MQPDRAVRRDRPIVSVIIPTVSQATHLSACLAALQGTTDAAVGELDIVVVLNGATAAVRDVARATPGIRLVDSAVNRGFAGGCRLGMRASTAPLVVFLNDDVVVTPGWLAPLLETVASIPQAAAVGVRVLDVSGVVQEIGSVIWSDGSTRPLGRGQPSASSAWRWRHRVDYCSACALLVRRAAWDEVGGFDEGYHPAYYEDVDFGLALAAAGHEVWVDPRSTVVHAESASSSLPFKQFLFERQRARLVARWGAALTSCLAPPRRPEEIDAVCRAAVDRLAGPGPRVLLLDDRVPRHGLGSGFDRMADALLDLAASGARVRCLPTQAPGEYVPTLAAAGVSVVTADSVAQLQEHLAASDVVIASRPNNAALLMAAREQLAPEARPVLIYDAEALYHRRLERQAALSDPALGLLLRAQAAEWLDRERLIAGCSDAVVCVSHDEAAFFRHHGAGAVHVVTPWLRQPSLTDATLRGRADIGFVAGWMAGAGSPNADALEWFAGEVLPRVARVLPWIRLRVTGTLPEPLRRLEGPRLRVEGFVNDLAGFYRQLRVAVAPIRFGAGVKLKTVEALQYGVPVVATGVGAEGLDEDVAAAITVHDDPEPFAEALVRLLTDAGAWRAQRTAIEQVMATHRRTAGAWPAVLATVLTERERADVHHAL